MEKQKILIVDDSELNRSILGDILGDEYEILEATDGMEAIGVLQKKWSEISIVLLDAVMPRMNGFEVLQVMNQSHWIEDTPVIMISAESSPDQVERAYRLGVTDFIMRPFDALIVYRRVANTILLYSKQKKLVRLVADQIDEQERQNSMMVDILSHIVEFRNAESSLHIVHVRNFTELVLRQLLKTTELYSLKETDIALISTASALHDIGKIAIDGAILNKPGKLTAEEFEIMKSHSLEGARILENLPAYQNEPLVKRAWEICRWHHERYDGRGYPDGLKGDEIPISAQVVALADVYDALTSERCYKAAIPHEKALQMIVNGECGSFNPILLDCLNQVEAVLKEGVGGVQTKKKTIMRSSLTKEILHQEKLFASERSLDLLDQERMKNNFFATMTEEIQFEYSVLTDMATFSAWGARKLGVEEFIMNPTHDAGLQRLMGEEACANLRKKLEQADPENPIESFECQLSVKGGPRWYRIVTRTLWINENPPRCTGIIGKAMDIQDSRLRMEELAKQASHDAMTGLLNHTSARKQIEDRMRMKSDGKYALVMFDLDKFKAINDAYGHGFGDRVLKYIAGKLEQSVRGSDIAARIGGDEFLFFLQYKTEIDPVIRRIHNALIGSYENIPVSVSMGVALTEVLGQDYSILLHAADQALYSAKRTGRGNYAFYDSSMEGMFSMVSAIDSDK